MADWGPRRTSIDNVGRPFYPEGMSSGPACAERLDIVNESVCRIDDFGPLPVVRPGSVAEVGALVRRAAAEGQALYPVGGRTLLGLGLPPSRPGWALDLR